MYSKRSAYKASQDDDRRNRSMSDSSVPNRKPRFNKPPQFGAGWKADASFNESFKEDRKASDPNRTFYKAWLKPRGRTDSLNESFDDNNVSRGGPSNFGNGSNANKTFHGESRRNRSFSQNDPAFMKNPTFNQFNGNRGGKSKNWNSRNGAGMHNSFNMSYEENNLSSWGAPRFGTGWKANETFHGESHHDQSFSQHDSSFHIMQKLTGQSDKGQSKKWNSGNNAGWNANATFHGESRSNRSFSQNDSSFVEGKMSSNDNRGPSKNRNDYDNSSFVMKQIGISSNDNQGGKFKKWNVGHNAGYNPNQTFRGESRHNSSFYQNDSSFAAAYEDDEVFHEAFRQDCSLNESNVFPLKDHCGEQSKKSKVGNTDWANKSFCPMSYRSHSDTDYQGDFNQPCASSSVLLEYEKQHEQTNRRQNFGCIGDRMQTDHGYNQSINGAASSSSSSQRRMIMVPVDCDPETLQKDIEKLIRLRARGMGSRSQMAYRANTTFHEEPSHNKWFFDAKDDDSFDSADVSFLNERNRSAFSEGDDSMDLIDTLEESFKKMKISPIKDLKNLKIRKRSSRKQSELNRSFAGFERDGPSPILEVNEENDSPIVNKSKSGVFTLRNMFDIKNPHRGKLEPRATVKPVAKPDVPPQVQPEAHSESQPKVPSKQADIQSEFKQKVQMAIQTETEQERQRQVQKKEQVPAPNSLPCEEALEDEDDDYPEPSVLIKSNDEKSKSLSDLSRIHMEDVARMKKARKESRRARSKSCDIFLSDRAIHSPTRDMTTIYDRYLTGLEDWVQELPFNDVARVKPSDDWRYFTTVDKIPFRVEPNPHVVVGKYIVHRGFIKKMPCVLVFFQYVLFYTDEGKRVAMPPNFEFDLLPYGVYNHGELVPGIYEFLDKNEAQFAQSHEYAAGMTRVINQVPKEGSTDHTPHEGLLSLAKKYPLTRNE